MPFPDFRQTAATGDLGKAERLFRAAVSAFCSLTRPSRLEVAQLEDLTLPLFDSVSVESLRYVAAALSECRHVPAALIRRLCDEPVDVAAPLLIRSAALKDIDLIALIGRHGLPHARAIARRSGLNNTIATLISALESSASLKTPDRSPATEVAADVREDAEKEDETVTGFEDSNDNAHTQVEKVRHRLRMMMRNPQRDDDLLPADYVPRAEIFSRLRTTALSGNLAFFQTALADALQIDYRCARTITETSGYGELLMALRALELEDEQAFLLAAAVYPKLFGHTHAVRLFVERYHLCHAEAAREKLLGWKAETLSAAFQHVPTPQPATVSKSADNSDLIDRGEPAAQQPMLKAS